MITREEKIARLRLIRSKNVGNATFWSLLKLYGSALEALDRIPKIDINLKFPLCSNEKLNKEISYIEERLEAMNLTQEEKKNYFLMYLEGDDV